MNTKHLTPILLACALPPIFAGCGGKKQEDATAGTAAPKTQEQAVQERLSNPNVSEQEKAQIRANMKQEPQPSGAK